MKGELLEQPFIKEKASSETYPQLAVLNMTRNCNLSCEYCYVNGGKTKDKMSSETALRIIDEMLKLNKNEHRQTTILFHGGEPLLNFNVIKTIVRKTEKAHGRRVKFAIQTNGTLITEEHVKFFKQHDFGVGVSVDGPEQLHNSTRRMRNSSGSFDETIRGIKLLREGGVNCGGLVVLTKANYKFIKEIFETLLSLGIRLFSLNPFFPAGAGENRQSLSLSGFQLSKAYKAMVQQLAEHNSKCLDVGEQMEERTLKYLVRNILLKESSYMCMRNPCGAGLDTFGFDVDGNVYACHKFVYLESFKLGNIKDHSLDYFLNNKLNVHIGRRSVGDSLSCSKCVYRVLCNGICPAHVHFSWKEKNKGDPECKFRKLIIPYLAKMLANGTLKPEYLDKE